MHTRTHAHTQMYVYNKYVGYGEYVVCGADDNDDVAEPKHRKLGNTHMHTRAYTHTAHKCMYIMYVYDKCIVYEEDVVYCAQVHDNAVEPQHRELGNTETRTKTQTHRHTHAHTHTHTNAHMHTDTDTHRNQKRIARKNYNQCLCTYFVMWVCTYVMLVCTYCDSR